MANYVNPNLLNSLHFNSPNSTARDRFATTNIGFTTAVKTKPKNEYMSKVEEEKKLREGMRKEVVLDNKFEYGFNPSSNCPSNYEKMVMGVPMYKGVTAYNTKNQEENKSLVEKQNFTISAGIAGGRAAE